jgi:uncharacterized glyoxalase superfamily protein PhnB/predicted enzyme related to lactoylglutathione lyase
MNDRPDIPDMPDIPSDPFDALRADTTPIAPPTHVDARVRRLVRAEQERLMTETTPVAHSMPRRITADLSAAPTVTPYLCVDGAAAAIEFYVDAFGAVEHHRMVGDDGRIGHAEIVIGNSRIMLADEYPEVGVLAPTTRGGSSTNFTVATPDAATLDAIFARALELGATELRPIADQFYGHRQGTLVDPFGHQWSISAPIEDFGDDRYDSNSRDAGFEVVRPEREHPDDDLQVKHHEPGDLFYFTLPVTDLARAQAFFGAVLGWRFDDPGNGHVSNISAPPGGFELSPEPAPPRLWFVVDDIDAAVARVRQSGGTATDPVRYDSGWDSTCTDDQGTPFHLSVPAAKYTR